MQSPLSVTKTMDYNIEFAHIYVDQNPSEEQMQSIARLKSRTEQLREDGKSYTTVILIDEFSPQRTILDVEAYIERTKKDAELDFVAFESQLAMFTYKFLAELPQELIVSKKVGNVETKTFVNGATSIGLITHDNKPSCTLLIAIWYLVRFGVYGIPAKTRKFSSSSFAAQRLLTILSKKYEDGEYKVLELLKHTKFKEMIPRIEYEFF